MKRPAICAVCLLVAFLTGCADSHRPITISLSPNSAQAIDNGQSVVITATLVNDTHMQGVNWVVSGGGSLSGQTATSATYQAPASGAASNATVTATAVADSKATVSLMIAVSPLPSFGAINLPDATEGVAYSQSVTATGGTGTLTYSLASGSLPAGLNLSSAGAITGTPAGPAGKSAFTVKVTDSSMAGPQSVTSSTLSINVVLPPAPTITTTALPGGTVGTAYNQTVMATGGVAPLTFSISAGALPGGLSISSSGTISGTPTASGPFTFTVTVTDSAKPTGQTGSKQFNIQVAAVVATLSVTTTSLPNGTASTAYSATLQSSGGTAPVAWSVTVGSLPVGLSLNASTGAITGTPSAAGTTNFTVQAADSGSPQQKATKALSITIATAIATCNPANTGSESLLHGQYAMVLKGFDSVSQPVLVGATFDADGAGHLAMTYGVEESIGVGSLYSGVVIDGTQSSYSLGSDHRGCMRIVTGKGTQIFRIAVGAVTLGVAARAQVIEADTTGTNVSGALYLQDSTAFSAAKLKGAYAFALGAPQPSGTGRTCYGAAGIFNLDGVGSLSGEMDINDSGTFNRNGTTFPVSPLAIPSGGAYSVDAHGRGLFSFTPGTGAAFSSTDVIYVISASKFLILSTDPPMSAPLFAGEAALQTGTPYTNASMNATSVFGTEGINNKGATVYTEVRAGVLLPQSGRMLYDTDLFGGIGPTATVSYPVDVNGRVSVATAAAGLAILYLSGPNQGYILFIGQDSSNNAPDTTASSGFFLPQSGAPFNDATFGGINWVFGSAGANSPSYIHTEGTATFVPNPAFATSAGATATGTTDTDSSGTLSVGAAYSQNFLLGNPTIGFVMWEDNASSILQSGVVVSPKAIIAITRNSAAPALLYYFAQ